MMMYQRERLSDHIRELVLTATSEGSNFVKISLDEAMLIADALRNADNKVPFQTEHPAGVLFYCIECNQSFYAASEPDKECLQKWHYRRWTAKCPKCGNEAVVNDRYWR